MSQPHEEEERDDAVVGRAFVWSASLIGLLIAASCGFFYWKSSQKPPKVEVTTEFEPPKPRKEVEIPEMPFKDITTAAGIRFIHESGAAGEKLLPETMKSSVFAIVSDFTFCPCINFSLLLESLMLQ